MYLFPSDIIRRSDKKVFFSKGAEHEWARRARFHLAFRARKTLQGRPRRAWHYRWSRLFDPAGYMAAQRFARPAISEAPLPSKANWEMKRIVLRKCRPSLLEGYPRRMEFSTWNFAKTFVFWRRSSPYSIKQEESVLWDCCESFMPSSPTRNFPAEFRRTRPIGVWPGHVQGPKISSGQLVRFFVASGKITRRQLSALWKEGNFFRACKHPNAVKAFIGNF